MRGLCAITKAESPTLRTVRLSALCPPESAESGERVLGPKDWLHFLGEEGFEAGEAVRNHGHTILKNMRTPAGIQQYKLSSLEAHILGRYAINAGIKLILGHMLAKEDLEALNFEG